ncbi:MAG: hypothetical protein II794_03200 [Oscillospiraceae bacterium]|nr:hypothetical protein [Oscillospiraceae bacterium]
MEIVILALAIAALAIVTEIRLRRLEGRAPEERRQEEGPGWDRAVADILAYDAKRAKEAVKRE